jgi:acylphosphatase
MPRATPRAAHLSIEPAASPVYRKSAEGELRLGRSLGLSATILCFVKEELQARRFVATGRVQGVGYRNFVEHTAGRIGVQGYVRNRRDGSVEVFAMGQPEHLKQLRTALERGPMMAYVDNVAEEPDTVDSNYLGHFIIEMTV